MSYLKHTPDPSKQWFVLRATYNRQQKAYDYIVNSSSHADAEVYLPLWFNDFSLWFNDFSCPLLVLFVRRVDSVKTYL